MSWLSDFMAVERLPAAFAEVVETVCVPLAERIAAEARPPAHLVGICGPQGSGKSTLAAVVRRLLEARGLKVALLALDDLYLTRAERQALARDVHPLLAVRGVPGTHDVALGEALLDALGQPGAVALPLFDKASDDRAPPALWAETAAPVDVVLFEGWCVGARAQAPEALAEPVNALERDRDPEGGWRRYVNDQLAGHYRRLFDRIGSLILFQPPGFEVVLDWRREQERKLRERLGREGADPARSMTDAQVAEFVAHYERLTRHILAEMPGRADVVIPLDAARRLRQSAD